MDQIYCTKCRTPLSAGFYNIPNFVDCPSCGVPIRIDIFPAFLKGDQGGSTGEAVNGEEASCFYHPGKKAAIACDHCGRFLCDLCDIQFGSEHICSSCLESGKKKGKIVNLERHRTLYDRITLKLAIYPLFIFYFTIITAPITLYLVIRHWKSPRSILGGGRVRFVMAGLISLLEIAGWVLAISYLSMLRW